MNALPVTTILAIITLTSACGPSTPPADASQKGAAEHEHAEHGDGHPGHANLAGPTKDLHEAFAPLWHMEKGDARAKKTCDAVPELKTLTEKVAAEPSPAKQAAAKSLSEKLDVLATGCAKEGRAEFEPLFSSAHDALHALMEAK